MSDTSVMSKNAKKIMKKLQGGSASNPLLDTVVGGAKKKKKSGSAKKRKSHSGGARTYITIISDIAKALEKKYPSVSYGPGIRLEIGHVYKKNNKNEEKTLKECEDRMKTGDLQKAGQKLQDAMIAKRKKNSMDKKAAKGNSRGAKRKSGSKKKSKK